MHFILLCVSCAVSVSFTFAFAKTHGIQRHDTLEVVKAPLVVEGTAISVRYVLPAVLETQVVGSKKAEAIVLSPADANLALNCVRQAFSRVAGVMIWENDGTGVHANIAVRGLSPNRSWEFNTRMDGVDIAADIAGYPEAYFTPAFESLDRVEIVRGTASLQYGPQFGGLLNYVTKSAPRDRAVSVESSQIGGQYGYYSTYTALGGTRGDWSYYAFANYRRSNGWRLPVQLRDGSQKETGRFWQYSVMPKVEYRLTEHATVKAELTLMQYRVQQPGGLDSAQFAVDPRAAMRYRDWFGVRWIVPILTYQQQFSDGLFFDAKLFSVIGERESIGLTTSPTIADTGNNPRRVNVDTYLNVGLELRGRPDIRLFETEHPIAIGIRLYRGNTLRKQGRGPDGEEFSTNFVRPLTRDLSFVSENLAAFTEWSLRLSSSVSITPGMRIEWLRMSGEGTFSREKPASDPDAFDTLATLHLLDKRAIETLPLFGIGLLWQMAESVDVYGNAYQNWRPAQFSELFPNDPTIAVDPALRSARGISCDLGIRGNLSGIVSFDISGFYLFYGNRIGVVVRGALGGDTVLLTSDALQLRRNLGASEHRGIEFYAEFFAHQLFRLAEQRTSLFIAGSYTDARYTAGPTVGKRVEYAPEWVVRSGLRYQWGSRLAFTVQVSHTGECFSDANNTISSASGVNGIIPAYTLWDFSSQYLLTDWLRLELNVNNLFDRRYFTRRTGGYPGPGIIPADGRMITGGFRFVL